MAGVEHTPLDARNLGEWTLGDRGLRIKGNLGPCPSLEPYPTVIQTAWWLWRGHLKAYADEAEAGAACGDSELALTGRRPVLKHHPHGLHTSFPSAFKAPVCSDLLPLGPLAPSWHEQGGDRLLTPLRCLGAQPASESSFADSPHKVILF